MGIACLQLPPSRLRPYAQTFCQRAEALVAALRGIGWDARLPKACEWGGRACRKLVGCSPHGVIGLLAYDCRCSRTISSRASLPSCTG